MDNIIEFADLTVGNKAVKRIAQAFTRAGAPVVSIDVDPKTQRSSGVSFRNLHLTFADSQKLTLSFKQSGDIWRTLINGSVVPLKEQMDQKKAVAELVKHLDAGRAKHQAKLARVKAELPKGIRTAAPRMEVALQQKSEQLDTQIGEAKATVNALREELGEPLLDSAESVNLDEARALAALIVDGGVLDDTSHAAATLRQALDVVETNYPINVSNGNAEQAELERRCAESFREALALLGEPVPRSSKAGERVATHENTTGVGQQEVSYSADIPLLDGAADRRDDDDERDERALDNSDEQEDEQDEQFDGEEYAPNENQTSLFDGNDDEER